MDTSVVRFSWPNISQDTPARIRPTPLIIPATTAGPAKSAILVTPPNRPRMTMSRAASRMELTLLRRFFFTLATVMVSAWLEMGVTEPVSRLPNAPTRYAKPAGFNAKPRACA